ncbi:TPA: 30S ribosomal protein S20 [Candidatus Poribacteria bacterium]|nr:30S ribosomal protein S20 [Candidatus Poribacteria bacterium]HEX28510.1 30S ribosomal protein S20 [Candidatus Poribacteria bacterium]
MPNKRSAYKHLRADPRKRLRNRMIKSATRTAIKKAEQAIASGDLEAAMTAFREAVSKLDKAAGKGVIKKGTADRKKSRLARKLNKLIAQSQAA